MTEKQMLQSLLELGADMRKAQKQYFTTSDRKAKQGFLIQSKKLEGRFDSAVREYSSLLKREAPAVASH